MNSTDDLYYTWGNGCEAWKLTDTPALSVIREKMPAGTSEKLHFHQQAFQLFYILKGNATFTIDGQSFEVKTGEHLQIQPGKKHKIANNDTDVLEFIVVSQPRAHGDRTDLE